MNLEYDATFDGTNFHPDQSVDLPPNTRVKLVVMTEPIPKKVAKSFLQVARELKLDGPSDFSENLDDYLYHGKPLNG